MSNCNRTETMVSSENREEAEKMAQLLMEMQPENQKNMEMFLKAIDFLGTWKEPA